MKKVFALFLCLSFIPVFVLAQEKIDINAATLEELEMLTGIGPVYAQRIIDARPFSSVDDLLKVSGIGEKTLQKIKEQGLAYLETTKVTIQEEPTETSEALPPNIQPPIEDELPQVNYPEGIIFSKVMPSPEGADSEEEWIEIKNLNNFEVDLTSWKIRDTEGSVKTHILSKKIKALGSLTLERPETGITLNNSGDGLELLNPKDEIIDSVNFGKAQTNIAFVKSSFGWKWDKKEETKKVVKPQEVKVESQDAQTETKEGIEIDLSNKKESKSSIFLTGLLVALLSSIFFIIFKRKLDRE